MRDATGRSLHDRPDAGQATETRQMAEEDQREPVEKAGPYALVVAALFVLAVVLIIALR